VHGCAPKAAIFAADRALHRVVAIATPGPTTLNDIFREPHLRRLVPVSQEIALNYTSRNVLGLPRILLNGRPSARRRWQTKGQQ
jgi:hypothetical protein